MNLEKMVRNVGGYGYEIKRDGTLLALSERPRRGRNCGERIWIGAVRRFGSGWAGYTRQDVDFPSYSGCARQMDAGRLVYEAWLRTVEA